MKCPQCQTTMMPDNGLPPVSMEVGSFYWCPNDGVLVQTYRAPGDQPGTLIDTSKAFLPASMKPAAKHDLGGED